MPLYPCLPTDIKVKHQRETRLGRDTTTKAARRTDCYIEYCERVKRLDTVDNASLRTRLDAMVSAHQPADRLDSAMTKSRLDSEAPFGSCGCRCYWSCTNKYQ